MGIRHFRDESRDGEKERWRIIGWSFETGFREDAVKGKGSEGGTKKKRDIRSIARLTCSANTILLSCLKNPLTGLSSGSVYANSAPASVISRTYTARAEGSRRAASACRPDAAVKACCRPPTPFPFLDAEGFGIDIDIDIDIRLLF